MGFMKCGEFPGYLKKILASQEELRCMESMLPFHLCLDFPRGPFSSSLAMISLLPHVDYIPRSFFKLDFVTIFQVLQFMRLIAA
jgi:hypothetical protein